MTRRAYDAQRSPQGALIVGNPEEVVEKIIRHSEALGGISRVTFQMNAASLPHEKMMRAIELIGTRVAPAVRERLAGEKHLSSKEWESASVNDGETLKPGTTHVPH